MEFQSRIDQNETPNGRILGTVRDEIFGFWKVVFSDGKGGTVPEFLEGKYTSQTRANDAIKAFLTTAWIHAQRLTKKKELREHKEKVVSA